jgi:hypothetical protein
MIYDTGTQWLPGCSVGFAAVIVADGAVTHPGRGRAGTSQPTGGVCPQPFAAFAQAICRVFGGARVRGRPGRRRRPHVGAPRADRAGVPRHARDWRPGSVAPGSGFQCHSVCGATRPSRRSCLSSGRLGPLPARISLPHPRSAHRVLYGAARFELVNPSAALFSPRNSAGASESHPFPI